MNTGILSEMTLPEVRAFAPEIVLLGVGSTEPHGPALPYGADYFESDALCRRATELANQRGGRVLMYPTLPIGNNVNFKPFPFACRVTVRTLMLMLLDVIQAVEEDGIRKVVLFDGHGGNTDAMRATLREHFDRTPIERRSFVCMTPGIFADRSKRLIEHPSPHGGESETSQMMYLRPELVRNEHLRNLPIAEPDAGLVHLDQTYFVRPWDRFLPLGGGGVVEKASAERGREIVESGAAGLSEFLLSLAKVPWHPGFPYAAGQQAGKKE